ncbi:MAG TPA: diguanylate cyclase, partial [Sulfuricurvum sp.]|nr:diguanylate cyclase [Sulfuricurvum sp.]
MEISDLIQNMFTECHSLNLLYVEDDRELSKNTYEMLKSFFHTIVVAYDGEEGLRAYQEMPFDIVLTDIMMPNLDGRAMSRSIRQMNPNQAIIVMSAHEDADYFMELIDIGISKFIPKPPSLQQMFGSIVPTAIDINNAKKIAMLSHEMKQDLAESKELLRRIIDTVPVRIFWKDIESRYLGCNTLFTHDAGLNSHSEILGKNDYDLPWRAEAKKSIDDDRYVMTSGNEKLNYDEKIIRQDGTIQWLSMSKVPLKGENGDIIGILGAYVDITEQIEAMKSIQQAKEALGYQAQHDALTGLPNRILYFDRLRQAIKKVTRTHQKVAVIFIDLDRFKEINDSLGHETGDEIVKLLGERLKCQLREVDTIARFGGDEFTILIESVDDVSDVAQIVQKMVKSMVNPFEVDNHRLYLTLSAGISIYPDDAVAPDILIRNADTAMYRAKEEGRNTYQFYTKEMTEKTFLHMLMTKNIRNAIDNQEFVVYYQPQIDAVSR